VNDKVKFDMDSVLFKLRRIRTDGSVGPDGLHPMVFANCAGEVAEPLAIIFQESYDSSTLPLDWKAANIVPIFKKGDKLDPNNYRPVSLTSVPCKIMESVIKDNMISVLETNHTISHCQHGFIRGRSCLTNLLESTEQRTHALDRGYGVDVLYLDYRKAFDSVPHKRILNISYLDLDFMVNYYRGSSPSFMTELCEGFFNLVHHAQWRHPRICLRSHSFPSLC